MMCQRMSLLSGSVFAVIAVVLSSVCSPRAVAAPPGPIYAQLSSSLTQMATKEGALVKMDSNDALGGLEHDD